MKQEYKYTLEVEKDGKLFSFVMPVNAGLGLAYDVAYDFMKVLKSNIDEHDKKLAEMKAKESATQEDANKKEEAPCDETPCVDKETKTD